MEVAPAGWTRLRQGCPKTAFSCIDGFVWRRGNFANYRETGTKEGGNHKLLRVSPRASS